MGFYEFHNSMKFYILSMRVNEIQGIPRNSQKLNEERGPDSPVVQPPAWELGALVRFPVRAW